MIENGTSAYLTSEDEDYGVLLSWFERNVVDEPHVIDCPYHSTHGLNLDERSVTITLGEVVMSGVRLDDVPPNQEALSARRFDAWCNDWPKKYVVTIARESSQNHEPIMLTLVLDDDDVGRLRNKVALMVSRRRDRTSQEWQRQREESRRLAHEALMSGLEHLRNVANDRSRD